MDKCAWHNLFWGSTPGCLQFQGTILYMKVLSGQMQNALSSSLLVKALHEPHIRVRFSGKPGDHLFSSGTSLAFGYTQQSSILMTACFSCRFLYQQNLLICSLCLLTCFISHHFSMQGLRAACVRPSMRSRIGSLTQHRLV